MSAKGDSGNHEHHSRKKLSRRVFAGILAFVILVLFVIFVVWLVLRPSKPTFYLQDATVYQFNATSLNTVTTTLQVSLHSRNPNDRIGIYYDRLRVYTSYRNQQVTVPTLLPRTYQGHNDANVWSPVLYGFSVPVGPYITAALAQDQQAGYVVITVKVDGHLSWKVGTWVSGHYHIYVICPAYGAYNGAGAGATLRLQQPIACSTDV